MSLWSIKVFLKFLLVKIIPGLFNLSLWPQNLLAMRSSYSFLCALSKFCGTDLYTVHDNMKYFQNSPVRYLEFCAPEKIEWEQAEAVGVSCEKDSQFIT